MASLLEEHSGFVCNCLFTKKKAFIKIKNIKETDVKKQYFYYIMVGSEVNIYYFKKVADEWVVLDNKFNFEYSEVMKHEKKDMETIKEELNTKTNKIEQVRVAEETVSLYFRDNAVLIRVTA